MIWLAHVSSLGEIKLKHVSGPPTLSIILPSDNTQTDKQPQKDIMTGNTYAYTP